MAQKPADYNRVVKFREVLRRYKYFEPGVLKVNSEAATIGLMSKKPLLDWTAVGYPNFKNLPKESLGFQFAKYMEANQLSLLDYSKDADLNDEEYYIRRVVQTHDVWHVVLEYPTTEVGELGINSFMLAQIGWPPAGFYIGGYILRQMLKAPHTVPEVIASVSEGWRRGRLANSFFAVAWETQFNRPLIDIRRELLPKETTTQQPLEL